jgi:hypothetical protein
MAFTTADLTALDRAIASSELEVELGGRRVKFDNVAGLLARRKYIEGVIETQDTPRPTGAFKYRFTTSRGD